MDLTEKREHPIFESRCTYNPSDKRTMLFQHAMVCWYEKNQRTYDWRKEPDAYKVLVSEIMLQQTNADKVGPVYTHFIQHYPSIKALAQAELENLRITLKPLGLSYRAGRLRKIAEKLATEYGEQVPSVEEALLSLPGIGRYIANAVLCFAYGKRTVLVDVNVIRLYERVFGFRSRKKRPREDREVWEFAEKMVPKTRFREYNLALLDFSARVCTLKKPECVKCPVINICLSHANGAQSDGD